jgi:hypothetical protein
MAYKLYEFQGSYVSTPDENLMLSKHVVFY